MKIFMVKSFCVATIMSISVLIGMQLANDGIYKMKGSRDASFQTAVSLDESDNDVLGSILGNEISSHDLKAKKKKLEEMSAYNFFSSMGKKMSEGLSSASEKIIHSITD